MHELWHWLLYVLAWSSCDAGMLDHERARTAGSVVVAYATLAQESPQPQPGETKQPQKCLSCDGSGRIYRPDGGWVKCSCSCSTGRCQTSKR